MAISHHLQLYPNLPLGLDKEFYRPPSLAAIRRLDKSLALREKFRIREFTLDRIHACPVDADGSLSPSAETSLGTCSESLSLELQVHRMTKTAPAAGGNRENGALQEVGSMPHACVKHEQAEDGEAGEQSGGALDLLLLASAGVETERGREDEKRQGTSCPVCDVFSTDSAIALSAHIVECLSETKNQKVKGRKKMRSIVDVIAADSKSDTPAAPAPLASRSPPVPAPASPETNDSAVKVTESLSHAEREMSPESPSQVTEAVKRSFRKRVARKSTDFIMEPLKKRRKKRTSIPYKGIKQRTSGRWAAEISDSAKKIRLWLGTFDTPEEAALAYDKAAIKIRGAAAQTNILSPEAAADSDELPAPVAANDDDGREEITAVEGITVVRSRKGRRKHRPEKLPLKAPQTPRGGQSETPRSDGSTEGTNPMTPQGNHNVSTATPAELHGDRNMNRELTPVMQHCESDQDIKTPIPVIHRSSDQDTKTATPVAHHCSDQDMKAATPVMHHCPDQDMKAATPETPASDHQQGKVATPPEVPVPLKIIDPHQAAGCEEEDIVVVSGRLGKGRPPKVKREEGFSTLVPNRKVARTRRPSRKMEEALEANNEAGEAGKVVIGSTLLEILD